jgi:hypothetical protein
MLHGIKVNGRITRNFSRTLFAVLALSTFIFQLSTLTSCTRTEFVDTPRENSVNVMGKSFEIERLRYDLYDLEYLDAAKSKEEIVSLKVMAGGAGVDVEIPRRLLGTRIDLINRDVIPGIDGLYYSFRISVRDDGDEEYGDWPYCRIRSWVVDHDNEDRFDDFGGWFSVMAGETADEWIFEWEVTFIGGDSNGKNFSIGYISSPFERIN